MRQDGHPGCNSLDCNNENGSHKSFKPISCKYRIWLDYSSAIIPDKSTRILKYCRYRLHTKTFALGTQNSCKQDYRQRWTDVQCHIGEDITSWYIYIGSELLALDNLNEPAKKPRKYKPYYSKWLQWSNISYWKRPAWTLASVWRWNRLKTKGALQEVGN